MTSHRLQPNSFDPSDIAPPGRCIHEIAAWLDDIEPVLRAVRRGGGAVSDGCVGWLKGHLASFRSAADWMETYPEDQEELDRTHFEAHWTFTRLQAVGCMTLELLDRWAADRAATPAVLVPAA